MSVDLELSARTVKYFFALTEVILIFVASLLRRLTVAVLILYHFKVLK